LYTTTILQRILASSGVWKRDTSASFHENKRNGLYIYTKTSESPWILPELAWNFTALYSWTQCINIYGKQTDIYSRSIAVGNHLTGNSASERIGDRQPSGQMAN